MHRNICVMWVCITFLSSMMIPHSSVWASDDLGLPAPGTMIAPSSAYVPCLLKGMTIHRDNPLQFDFIVDMGDDESSDEDLKEESTQLIKYFLTALTVPEQKMWVNLSPYEANRIIPDSLEQTDMGRVLLAQDYLLKQLTASLMYPEKELGQAFWDRVYQAAFEQYGATSIPMNTFNKVWIVPEKAVVYVKDQTVFVADHHLRVMLEEDYLALDTNAGHGKHGLGDVTKEELLSTSDTSTDIIREILIPEIEKEVNTGQQFAQLRQVFHSVILATWYKNNLKESLLGRAYFDQDKTVGLEHQEQDIRQRIYERYLQAFEVGVYNYMKEEYDVTAQEVIPRKYFSGGVDAAMLVETKDVKDMPEQHSIRIRILPTILEVQKEQGEKALEVSSTPDTVRVLNPFGAFHAIIEFDNQEPLMFMGIKEEDGGDPRFRFFYSPKTGRNAIMRGGIKLDEQLEKALRVALEQSEPLEPILIRLKSGKPLNIAHRGDNRLHPENTLKAFTEAIDSGADGHELDVQLSRDGRMMVTHDYDLTRITKGKDTRLISDVTAAELRRIDLGEGQRMPFIEEVMDLVKEKSYLNIEIKQKPSSDPPGEYSIDYKLIEMIREKGIQDSVILSSFYLPHLKHVRSLNPDIMVGFLMETQTHLDRMDRTVDDYIHDAVSVSASILLIHRDDLTPANVQKIHAAGLEAGTWDELADGVVKNFDVLKMHPKVVITNEPRKFLEQRESYFLLERRGDEFLEVDSSSEGDESEVQGNVLVLKDEYGDLLADSGSIRFEDADASFMWNGKHHLRYVLREHSLEEQDPYSTKASALWEQYVATTQEKKVGGIDMNPSNMNLEVHGDLVEFNTPMNLQELERININGITPVILKVLPATNMPLFLGAIDTPAVSPVILSRR